MKRIFLATYLVQCACFIADRTGSRVLRPGRGVHLYANGFDAEAAESVNFSGT